MVCHEWALIGELVKEAFVATGVSAEHTECVIAANLRNRRFVILERLAVILVIGRVGTASNDNARKVEYYLSRIPVSHVIVCTKKPKKLS